MNKVVESPEILDKLSNILKEHSLSVWYISILFIFYKSVKF